MKKTLSILLVISMVLGLLAACGKPESGSNQGEDISSVISGPESFTAEGDYGLKAAVLSWGGEESSQTALFMSQSLVLGMDYLCLDLSSGSKDISIDSLKGYDMVYLDENLAGHLSKAQIQAVDGYAKQGGAVFVPNVFYDSFSKEFFGAQSFVKLQAKPENLEFPDMGEDLKELQQLVEDFSVIYANMDNQDILLAADYGYGMKTAGAAPLVKSGSSALYTMNKYGEGLVFFTNPLLPNFISNGNLTMVSSEDSGVGFSNATVSFNLMIYSDFAKYVSKYNYGYSISKVYGYFGTPSMSWELHFEEIEGIENNTLITFSEIAEEYNQIPSYTITRDSYKWFLKTESVSYLLNKSGDGSYTFEMDLNEGAYSAGAHVNAGGKFLTQIGYTDTTSYFVDDTTHTNRAYPEIIDFDGDGNLDIFCGSQDGRIYYYKGFGYVDDRFSTEEACILKDVYGKELTVDSYSSPVFADINGDGILDIVSGSGQGKLLAAYGTDEGFLPFAEAAEFGLCKPAVEGQILPEFADINGDGITDMIAGSSCGFLKVYYGRQAASSEKGIIFDEENSVDLSDLAEECQLGSWLAPEAVDWDGDGVQDLALGTYLGYVFIISVVPDGDEMAFEPLGYISVDEINYKGNQYAKFGNYSVPRFADLNEDGNPDLICGSLEYGVACPIDDPLFTQTEALQAQIDYAKEHDYYVGAHFLTSFYASDVKENFELQAHRDALESYGVDMSKVGVNQHTWYTSRLSPTQTMDNIWNNGYLWNSGFGSAIGYGTNPQYAWENDVTLPFFMVNGEGEETLLIQNCTTLFYTPYGRSEISARYKSPISMFYHCDYAFQTDTGARSICNSMENFRSVNNYNFMKEDQQMMASAAVIHQRLNCRGNLLDDEGLIISSGQNTTDYKLYDASAAGSLGACISFAHSFDSSKLNVDADIMYEDFNGDLIVGLNRAVTLKLGDEQTLANHFIRINIAAEPWLAPDGSTGHIRFLSDGYMEAEVSGSAHTNSEGWETIHKSDSTVFCKFGSYETLEIEFDN